MFYWGKKTHKDLCISSLNFERLPKLVVLAISYKSLHWGEVGGGGGEEAEAGGPQI